MLQLTTRTNHRLALEPAHLCGVEELPVNPTTQEEFTLRTRLYLSSGIVLDVTETFEHTYDEWAAQQEDDDPLDDPAPLDNSEAVAEAINEAQARIRSLELPASVADTPDMREAFEAFKGAVIEALATIE